MAKGIIGPIQRDCGGQGGRGGTWGRRLVFLIPVVVAAMLVVGGGCDALKKGDSAGEDSSATMHSAAAEGRLDTLESLKLKEADVNERNDYGQTPMFAASANGRINAMKWLKDAGADVNAKDNAGRTPISVAKDEKTKAWLTANGAAE